MGREHVLQPLWMCLLAADRLRGARGGVLLERYLAMLSLAAVKPSSPTIEARVSDRAFRDRALPSRCQLRRDESWAPVLVHGYGKMIDS